MKTIGIGELRQNPTQMLRDVKAGQTYLITDHGDPVAQISPRTDRTWILADDVDLLLKELGGDETWSREVADLRELEEARDPWVSEA